MVTDTVGGVFRYQDPSSDKKEAEEPADAFRYVLRRGLRSPSATSARIVMWEVVVFCKFLFH